MGWANFVSIRADYIAKGDYESHDRQNESTITMDHSKPVGHSR